MEALIVAAGRGSRLSNYYSPKPLLPLYGLRLLERIILTARNAGITDFKIVVGYKGEHIKKVLGNGSRYNVRIEYIDNPDWELGNGISVLKARGYMSSRFLLLMSDHLCSEAIIKKALKTRLNPGEVALCVDRNLDSPYCDPDDVTRVKCSDGKVKRIGKGMPEYDAIDTGVFICTDEIFRALERSIDRGEYSLSGGNQVLASEGKLKTVDVTGAFWIDVDNERALKQARKLLLEQLFKPTDGPISRNINRRISTRISSFLAGYNITPNTMTLLSFVVAFISGLFFFPGKYLYTLIGGILAQFSSILDGCDGEIARLKFRFSSFGEWLDRVLDRYSDGFIMFGMTYGLWNHSSIKLALFLGFLAIMGTFMNSYTARIFDEMLTKRGASNYHPGLRIGRDIRLFTIFVGSLFNQVMITLFLIGVITNVEAFRRVFLLRYRYPAGATN